MGHYTALCTLASEAEVHVELCADDVLNKNRDGQWRKIIGVRLAHESGRVFAHEQMADIAGLDQASKKLIEYLEGHHADK